MKAEKFLACLQSLNMAQGAIKKAMRSYQPRENYLTGEKVYNSDIQEHFDEIKRTLYDCIAHSAELDYMAKNS